MRGSRTALAAWLLTLLVSFRAAAEVKQASPGLVSLDETVVIAAKPHAVFTALARIGSWWSSDHTFSGSARNLHLTLRAGGLFTEHWKQGDVEHGRVIHVERDRMVRLAAALGPLQAMPVTGVLTFSLAPEGAGTKLEVTYLISGDASLSLDKLASAVDRVIGEQVARLARFAETGSPTPPTGGHTR